MHLHKHWTCHLDSVTLRIRQPETLVIRLSLTALIYLCLNSFAQLFIVTLNGLGLHIIRNMLDVIVLEAFLISRVVISTVVEGGKRCQQTLFTLKVNWGKLLNIVLADGLVISYQTSTLQNYKPKKSPASTTRDYRPTWRHRCRLR